MVKNVTNESPTYSASQGQQRRPRQDGLEELQLQHFFETNDLPSLFQSRRLSSSSNNDASPSSSRRQSQNSLNDYSSSLLTLLPATNLANNRNSRDLTDSDRLKRIHDILESALKVANDKEDYQQHQE